MHPLALGASVAPKPFPASSFLGWVISLWDRRKRVPKADKGRGLTKVTQRQSWGRSEWWWQGWDRWQPLQHHLSSVPNASPLETTGVGVLLGERAGFGPVWVCGAGVPMGRGCDGCGVSDCSLLTGRHGGTFLSQGMSSTQLSPWVGRVDDTVFSEQNNPSEAADSVRSSSRLVQAAPGYFGDPQRDHQGSARSGGMLRPQCFWGPKGRRDKPSSNHPTSNIPLSQGKTPSSLHVHQLKGLASISHDVWSLFITVSETASPFNHHYCLSCHHRAGWELSPTGPGAVLEDGGELGWQC